jgi:acyl-CoA reductase-like NAD-dependent aldehyde dehydrogenase
LSLKYWAGLEKLSPVLGMFKAKDFAEALEVVKNVHAVVGKGHTSSIFTCLTK